MTLYFKKINNNFHKIFLKDSNKLKKIEYRLDKINIPFGLEEYKNKYILNLKINKNNILVDIINILEEKLKKHFPDKIINNIFKDSDSFFLCRTSIIQRKNVIITKFFNNKKELTIFNIKKKCNYNIYLEISGVWFFENTYGLCINIKKLNLII